MDNEDDIFSKIVDKLFVYVENKDLNINRIRSLVVNPQILRVLIQQLSPLSKEIKRQVLAKLSTIYSLNSLNPCIMFKRDREILEFNHSIFDEIITFVLSIKQDISENKQLIQCIRALIRGYPIGCRGIKNLIKEVAKDFFKQKFSSQKLDLTIRLLSEFYKNQIIVPTQPRCYFFIYGPNSGIRMVNNQVNWTLFKGFYYYMSFYIEGEQHEGMSLLNITINNDSFELQIHEGNWLTVKVFSVSKIFKLRRLEAKKWYFLKLAYCLRTGIMRNSFQLMAYIDGEPYQLKDLPIPSPTMKDSIEQLIIGYEFYGKINVAALSRNQIHYWPKSGVNNWSQIQGLLLANKGKVKDIFLLYSPILVTQFKERQIIYEITSKNHAEMLQNTAIFHNPFEEVDINYYGGIYTILPFFNILRYYKYEQYPTALQDLCNLLVQLFQLGFNNIEIQAINCQFFPILTHFFNTINEKYITPEVIEILSVFKDIIENKSLKKQFFASFLWKINTDRITNIKTVEKLHRTISWFYFNNFTWAIQIMPLSSIIWYILDNFQPENSQNCCLLHSWELQSTFDEQNMAKIKQQYKQKGEEISLLLKFIIKQLCKKGKFDEIVLSGHKQQVSGGQLDCQNILQFLIQDNSMCFKKMLMNCIEAGLQEDPLSFIRQTQVMGYMFFLLPKAQFKDQISPIIRILTHCIWAYSNIKNLKEVNNIIDHIGHQLDRIYMKQYSAIRVRSKSEGLSSIKRMAERKLSVCEQGSNRKGEGPIKLTDDKQFKQKFIKFKKEKQIKLSNDKQLFDLIRQICCVRDDDTQQYILIEDYYTKIIGSYFKICSPKLKIKLIEMVRNTILLKFKEQKLPPNMEGLCKFDRIYTFILSEFVLKELDPDDPDYLPSENSNYVMKNLFFIVDHVVISLKNNWNALYLYLIRCIALLKVASKEIRKKTQRDPYDVYLAKKISVRKFVLRVMKNASKSIQNMSNMVFLVFLVVFSNSEEYNKDYYDIMSVNDGKIDLPKQSSGFGKKRQQSPLKDQVVQRNNTNSFAFANPDFLQKQKRSKSEGMKETLNKPKIFKYFQSLEEHFLLIPFQLVNSDTHNMVEKDMFLDQKLILEVMDCLRFHQLLKNPQGVEEMKVRKINLNMINAYFQKSTNQINESLYTLRKVLLSNSKFQQLNKQEIKGIRSMFTSFISEDYMHEKSDQPLTDRPLYVCEFLGLLTSLCIEETLRSKRIDKLRESLDKYESFIKVLILVCSRDWLKKSEHSKRNKNLPRNITYHMIHFLYNALTTVEMISEDQKQEEILKSIIQDKLLNILNFLTLVITVLSEKVGNPNTLEDAMMLSQVMQDVEQYNFFSFEVLLGVITLGEIKMFSTLPQQKKINVMLHPQMMLHFKNKPKVFLEKNMKDVIQIHFWNNIRVFKEINVKFEKDNKPMMLKISDRLYNEAQNYEQQSLKHARKVDGEYRTVMRVWRKIWKRLRLYHYYWSVSMNQKEVDDYQWKKYVKLPYKYKMSKYTDLEGLRPILEVQPNEPWHVRKAQMDQEVAYRAKNFMVNLYKPQSHKKIQPKSFIDKWFRKSMNVSYFNVDWIKHNSKRKGRLSLTKQKLIFEYAGTFQKDSHVDFTSFTLAQHRPMQKFWPLVQIIRILKRRYLTKMQCLLIQFEDSTAITFNFLDENSEQFLDKIEQIQNEKVEMLNFMKINQVNFYFRRFKKNSGYSNQAEEATAAWQAGKITNLHYLMILNKFSGRSCLDPVNYPVVPWVVTTYDCKELIFRDLSKTLGALGSESRRDFYINKTEAIDSFSDVPPYQYGTHYSSPGVVFNFLVRLSPYTEAARTLQGGRFDLSDRLFSSIQICWKSVTSQVSDVRQLLPQFYYLPQFLINLQNHDFGITQTKQRIHNVKLPIWGSTPYSFIARHRRALQSQQVTSTLNNWIDLIFGYKQKGKLAQQNINLYYYLTYENSIDLSQVEDKVEKTSIQAQIIHFGQTPSQLFFKPHPQKSVENMKDMQQVQNTKIRFLGNIPSASPLVLLNYSDQQNIFFFKDFNLLHVSLAQGFKIKMELDIHRQTSKQNFYHVEDLNSKKKVSILGGKFVVVGSYVNGDLVIFSLATGKKVFHKKGIPKTIIYVNNAQNLVLCGCKNGLLQVYQVVYSEKDHIVTLLKISEEYLMFSIEEITEGGGFYCIAAGNLVILNKINRGLAYIHDKVKMQGIKMIRSFQSKRKVFGAFICTNPLYCILFYNSLEVWVYSVNGQFLKLRQVQSIVNPVILIDYQHRQNLLVLQHGGLMLMQLPELTTLTTLHIPQKQFIDMKIINNRVYLITNDGQILSTSHFHQHFNMF